MRKLLYGLALSLGLACFSSPLMAQHAGMAASAAPAAHAAPAQMAPMPGVPVGGAHATPVHSAYAPQGHPAIHSVSSRPTVRSVTNPSARAPKAAWYPGLPPNPIAPIPPFVPNTPIILPGASFFGHSCFTGFGCFGPNHFRTGGVIIPFGGFGGFYMPIPYYEPVAPEQDQGAPDANASDQNENRDQQQAEAEESVKSEGAPNFYTPSEPIYEYVFVKRDGTKIFAVAYSLTNDKIQYVTREGLRRTLPLDSLDFDATQKSNEERGNTINLPAPPPAAMARAL